MNYFCITQKKQPDCMLKYFLFTNQESFGMINVSRLISALIFSVIWISACFFYGIVTVTNYKLICQKSINSCMLTKKRTFDKDFAVYKEVPISSIKKAIIMQKTEKRTRKVDGETRTYDKLFYQLCFYTQKEPVCTFYYSTDKETALSQKDSINNYLFANNTQDRYEISSNNEANIPLMVTFIIMGCLLPFTAISKKSSKRRRYYGS